jgi:hypothetical protein
VVENLTDYFALELDEGKLKYYLNFGDQTQIGSIPEVSSDDTPWPLLMLCAGCYQS